MTTKKACTKQFTYYIGLNDKDEHKQLYPTDRYVQNLIKLLETFEIENFTYSIVNGVYKSEVENTIKLEIIGEVECELLQEEVETIKFLFNQECIYKTVQKFETAGCI